MACLYCGCTIEDEKASAYICSACTCVQHTHSPCTCPGMISRTTRSTEVRKGFRVPTSTCMYCERGVILHYGPNHWVSSHYICTDCYCVEHSYQTCSCSPSRSTKNTHLPYTLAVPCYIN